jgi:hypothetical protein
MPHHASHKDADAAERSDLDPPEEPTGLDQTPTTEDWAAGREQPEDPLWVLTAAMARVFGLKLMEPSTVLDQLLAAKRQLRAQGVDPAAVELALPQMLPSEGASLERSASEAGARVALRMAGLNHHQPLMCPSTAGEPGLAVIEVLMPADGEPPAHFTMVVALLTWTYWPDALHPVDLTN